MPVISKIITSTIIISLVIIFISLAVIFVPYKKAWLSDSVVYGNTFCQTFDGRCLSTDGHFTATKLSNFQLHKYAGYYKLYDSKNENPDLEIIRDKEIIRNSNNSLRIENELLEKETVYIFPDVSQDENPFLINGEEAFARFDDLLPTYRLKEGSSTFTADPIVTGTIRINASKCKLVNSNNIFVIEYYCSREMIMIGGPTK